MYEDLEKDHPDLVAWYRHRDQIWKKVDELTKELLKLDWLRELAKKGEHVTLCETTALGLCHGIFMDIIDVKNEGIRRFMEGNADALIKGIVRSVLQAKVDFMLEKKRGNVNT